MQAVDEPVDNPVDFNQFREPLLEDQSQPNYKAIWIYITMSVLYTTSMYIASSIF